MARTSPGAGAARDWPPETRERAHGLSAGEYGRAPHPAKRRRKAWARRTPPGAPPGTLVVDPTAPPPVVRVIAYGPHEVVEQEVTDPGRIRDFLGRWPVTWVNVEGLGDAGTVRALGELFGLHPLALEDVIHVHQRAKVEQYDAYHFIVARMVRLDESVGSEQLSLFLGHNFVLTFQEGYPGDCLEAVRTRLRKGQGQIRGAGADYLAYALLDAVVDCYFPVLEEYGERLEQLEAELIARPGAEAVSRLHTIKRDLLALRRALWPQREAFNTLLRDDAPLITHETRLHLRDCYDHTVQLIDLVETYRELSADLMDVYLSSVGNRTNEIMRVLTVIATVFMPLTFIAGVYGMNFNPAASPWNMPELNWYWGYPFSLTLMAGVAFAQLVFFWRRGWLGAPLAGRRVADEGGPTPEVSAVTAPARREARPAAAAKDTGL
ncbi:MAG: magnesium/cobalt transporter CorA [Thermodesulfobacteriota bacterium]|jgi:magnesium transporter